MPINRSILTSTATSAAAAYTDGDAALIPRGADLCGATILFANDGYNGATIEAKAQGCISSTDPDTDTEWFDIDDGDATATADGTELLGSTDRLISLLPYTHVRVVASTSAGGPPTGDGSYTLSVNVQVGD